MYIIKNACKNLVRNKKRYLLEGCIVFLLLIGVCISIIVGDTLSAIIEDYENRFQVNASLDIDYMSLLQKGKLNDYHELTQKELEQISKSTYVKKMYSSLDMGIRVKDVVTIGEGENKEENNLPEGVKEKPLYLGGEPMVTCNASLKGYDNLSQLSDFINGTRKLKDGRFYENVNECIISSELAEKNHLSVGGTINIQGSQQKKQTSLKIVGIYLDAKPVDNQHAQDPTTNWKNDILVSCDTFTANFENEMYSAYATYVMNSADHVEDFKKELKEQGILETYKLSSNKSDFDQMVKPVKKLGSIINTFQIIIMVCGIIVLLVLSILSVQERTYEIGVLRCRGMKKGKLVLQFVLENIIMVSVCLVLGFGISTCVSEPLSNRMLKEQISVFEEQQQSANQREEDPMSAVASFIDKGLSTAYGDNSNISQLEKVKIQFSTAVIVKIAGIALCLALLASMMSILTILRYEPSKILVNRN